MLPILIFLTSVAMQGNNRALTYGQFVELLNRKDKKIEQVSLTMSNTVIDLKGTYTDKNGEKGFTVTVPNTEQSNNELMTVLQQTVKEGNIKIIDAYKTNPLIEALIQIVPLIIVTGVGIYFISRMSGSQNNKAFEFSKSRARLEGNIKVKFKDVAGCDEEKEEMEEIISYLKSPEKFAKMGARIPKGILMVGPPGTGKTLLAKAVAGEADVPFYSISGADFVEMFVGVGASRVRDMFKDAKRTAPCMIFIDEIDAVGRQRGAGLGGGNDEREQTLNQLLVEMDGIEDNKGIVIIAATNRPDVLDPALLRPGRFDRQITVSLPDKNGRKAILEVHARNKHFAPDVDLNALAARTPGFSGADLENVLNEAAILAVRGNKNEITMEDLDEAIDRTMGGPAKKSRKYSDKEKKLVATHEAGHAVVGLFLEGANIVQKVTIIPRGVAGGYNLMTPKEDSLFLSTKKELLAQITGLLGGRVAEEIVLGEISTGASNDLEKVTKIAKAMVNQYGMSETIGPVQYDSDGGNVFLGRDYTSNKSYSDTVAYEIDQEVRRIVNSCYDEARAIITEHRKDLDNIVRALIENETLTKEDLDTIIQYGTLKPEKVEENHE
ncbi:MAG: ATP-dependent zinc metalloprotease FtsH [Erysipelotrichaceae bacterium]|nr:ATP-dependent zinc metalloprotease FtsH [Erysipelotrichaceae bacterium]